MDLIYLLPARLRQGLALNQSGPDTNRALHVTGAGSEGTNDPSVLILGHPTAAGTGLIVQVYAGAADLFDLAVLVAQDSNGGVVASTHPAASPQLLGHASAVQTGPSVSVSDANANGKLDAGDSISVSGLEETTGMTLWVASQAGQMLASQSLSP